MQSFDLVLGSGSPRRKMILEEAGYQFSIRKSDVDETIPPEIAAEKAPEYLAELKAEAIKPSLNENELLLTADTLVHCDGEILGKPSSFEEAKAHLNLLSGKQHQVIGGYCLCNQQRKYLFSNTTQVYFKNLSEKEIAHYIENYQPFDKAGAYAIQEWIGLIGIEKIEGSYFNVVGLAMHKVYEYLQKFA